MTATVHALASRFRTCEVTGLRVEWHAETLIKVNAVVAVVNFLYRHASPRSRSR